MNILISTYNKAKIIDKKPTLFFDGYKEFTSLKEFAQFASCNPFSLALFVNNENGDESNIRRCKENFACATIIGLDFDSGIGLQDVDSICESLGIGDRVYVGSSNHIKDKQDGKGAVPRFHLMFPISEPITDGEQFKFWLRYYVEKFGATADNAATDATRYFLHNDSCNLLKTVEKHFLTKLDADIYLNYIFNKKMRDKLEEINSKKYSEENVDKEFSIERFANASQLTLKQFHSGNYWNAVNALAGRFKSFDNGIWGYHEAEMVFNKYYTGKDRNARLKQLKKIMR